MKTIKTIRTHSRIVQIVRGRNTGRFYLRCFTLRGRYLGDTIGIRMFKSATTAQAFVAAHS